jgi:hypothetical protein
MSAFDCFTYTDVPSIHSVRSAISISRVVDTPSSSSREIAPRTTALTGSASALSFSPKPVSNTPIRHLFSGMSSVTASAYPPTR